MAGSHISDSEWDRDDRDDAEGADGADGRGTGEGVPNSEAREEEPQAERLALDDDDVSLPWLESDDDEEEEGSDTGRLIAFVLMGLAALALIVGGIWWATHRETDPELVADGSVIEAPATPFKEAPKDPGGKTFAGTGDSSFSVSEGKNPAARLGQAGEAPKPSIDVGPSPAPSAPAAPAKPGSAGTATAAPAAPVAAGIGVQVGAFSSKASAEAAWTRLQGQSEALSGVKHRVIEGQADIGTVYRLQAVAGDAAGASALCGKLKSAGISCQVKN